MLTLSSDTRCHVGLWSALACCGVLLAAVIMPMNTALADRLVYVYSPDCGACMKFDKEVGAIYDKTKESTQLPMIKIELGQWQQGDHSLRQCDTQDVFTTPTFIHLQDCIEVDRITGYSSDELFWFALERMDNSSNGHGSAVAVE